MLMYVLATACLSDLYLPLVQLLRGEGELL
jgi:hypothetical protein